MEKLNSGTNSSVSVDIHVVGHHKREEKALALADEVYAVDTWIDDGSLGEWENHLRAWTYASYSNASHVCIIQDDAQPIPDFIGHVQRAAEERPSDMLGLYVGTTRPHVEEVLGAVRKAEAAGAAWLSTDAMCWGVGIVVPTRLIPEMLSSVEKYDNIPWYDQRLSRWLFETDRSAYYTWPSLVDHEDEDSILWKTEQGARKAHRVGVPLWGGPTISFERHIKMLPSKKDLRRVR